MLNEQIKKELDKYSKETKANYKPRRNRMAKVHKQDHGDEDPPENPQPNFDNYYTPTEDSYPMQDSDIEDLD